MRIQQKLCVWPGPRRGGFPRVGLEMGCHWKDAVRRVAPADWPGSARGDVHRDFKAEAEIGRGGGLPLHGAVPSRKRVSQCRVAAAGIESQSRMFVVFGTLAKRTRHDFHLMIFMSRRGQGTPIVTLVLMLARALYSALLYPGFPPLARHEVPVGDGHDSSHLAMLEAMAGAPDGYAAHGDFGVEGAR